MSAEIADHRTFGNFADFAAAERWLLARKPRKRRVTLRPLRRSLSKLGHPQRAIPAVHVAGTNGKGSVCDKIAAALTLGGWRTGLFTSPHLNGPCERIRVDGICIDSRDLLGHLNELRAKVPQSAQWHFFDILFFIAIDHFRHRRVEVAVFEVGLGGRIDATNLCRPAVTIITTIGDDHRNLLGRTKQQIAREKGGIIKTGVPIILGKRAQNLGLEEIAANRGAPLIALHETALHADDYNQTLAIAALRTISAKFAVAPLDLARGVTSKLPGRLERITSKNGAPISVVFDAAHNREGLRQLSLSLAAIDPGAPLRIVLGIARSKDLAPCLGALANLSGLMLYPTSLERAEGGHSPQAIYRVAKGLKMFPMGCWKRGSDALLSALADANPGDLVIVCGSFQLIGPLRRALLAGELNRLLPVER